MIAVEPVAEMRAALPTAAESSTGPRRRSRSTTPSVDLVTVAQAFHWFDGDAALAEIHRVLRPGGRLALLWNRRAEDDPLNQALERCWRLTAPACRRTGRPAGGLRAQPLFGPLEEHLFDNAQMLDADGLADRSPRSAFSRRWRTTLLAVWIAGLPARFAGPVRRLRSEDVPAMRAARGRGGASPAVDGARGVREHDGRRSRSGRSRRSSETPRCRRCARSPSSCARRRTISQPRPMLSRRLMRAPALREQERRARALGPRGEGGSGGRPIMLRRVGRSSRRGHEVLDRRARPASARVALDRGRSGRQLRCVEP